MNGMGMVRSMAQMVARVMGDTQMVTMVGEQAAGVAAASGRISRISRAEMASLFANELGYRGV